MSWQFRLDPTRALAVLAILTLTPAISHAQDLRLAKAFDLGTLYAGATITPPVFVADVDGDGSPELVFRSAPDRIEVWHNDGRGGFAVQREITVPVSTAFALLDLDGDRRADLVIATVAPDTALWVMSGRRDGGFDPPRRLVRGVAAAQLYVGDFDGDGSSDLLATPLFAGGALKVVLLGSRGQVAVVPGPQVAGAISGVAVGDWNHDGHLDVATTTVDLEDSLRVLLGDGTGSLHLAASAFWPSEGTLVGFDVDGDGDLDLLECSDGDSEVLLLNQGDGVHWQQVFPRQGEEGELFNDFLATASRNVPASLFLSRSLDHYNTTDCVIYERHAGDWLEDRSGVAVHVGLNFPTAEHGYAQVLAATDLNGDGIPDLVLRRLDQGTNPVLKPPGVLVLLSRANGARDGLNSIPTAPLGAIAIVRNVRNRPPVLVSSIGGRMVAWRLNRGGGLDSLADLGRGHDPKAVVLDSHEGFDALVFGLGPDTTVVARISERGDRLEKPRIVTGGSYLDAGDLDADGISDLVLVGRDHGVRVAWGERGGDFQDVTDTGIADSSYAPLIRVVDATGDGRVRLLVATPLPRKTNDYDELRDFRVDLWDTGRDRRLGLFAKSLIPSVHGSEGWYSINEIAVGQLDGGPGDDFALMGSDADAGSSVVIFRPTGDGHYAADPEALPANGEDPHGLQIADFDGDGHPDISTVSTLESYINIAWNDGHGGFVISPGEPATLGETYDQTREVAVGDIDGDGRLDFVFTRQQYSDPRYAWLDICYGAANGPRSDRHVPSGQRALTAAQTIDASSVAISSVSPNPARGAMDVHFSLVDSSPARLEMIDIAGRRIVTRDVAGAAGLVHLELGSELRAGVYWLRLAQGAHQATLRVAVVR